MASQVIVPVLYNLWCGRRFSIFTNGRNLQIYDGRVCSSEYCNCSFRQVFDVQLLNLVVPLLSSFLSQLWLHEIEYLLVIFSHTNDGSLFPLSGKLDPLFESLVYERLILKLHKSLDSQVSLPSLYYLNHFFNVMSTD